jgi:mRNA interferase MazF
MEKKTKEADGNEKKKLMQVNKGEVYLYRSSNKETEGTEIMKTRLGVVISPNELNKWGKRFVIIPLTSKKTDNIYAYEVPIFFQEIKGKALLDQIRTVSGTRLIQKEGQLTEKEMQAIQEKIMSFFESWDYLSKKGFDHVQK